jgi:DNA polymerase III delta subunit
MITILHGEDTYSSAKALDLLLSTRSNITRLDGSSVTYQTILLELESQSLFQTEKTLVIQNPSKIKKKDSKEVFEKLASYNNSESTFIYLYSDSPIGVTILRKFPQAKISLYELPKYYFMLLDGLRPKNGPALKKNLDKALEQYTPEQVLYSIVKRIRILLLAKEGALKSLRETKTIQSWQEGKLRQQASAWDYQNLLKLYKKMFEIERNLKSGGLPMNLANSLDIALLLGVN